MLNLYIRNAAVFHVFAIVAMFTWICGGIRADLLVSVMPWFLLVLFTGMLFFPQVRHTETIVDARQRVWRGIVHDPLTWVSVALLVLLAIPFVNKGLCPVCDAELIASGADPAPPVKFLPFCVDRVDHYGVYQWFLPLLTATIAAKHSLLKRGKRMLLEMSVWNAVALAILGFVQQATGAQSPLWYGDPLGCYFFSAWGYPNMAGDYFTFMFIVSVGIWQYRVTQVANAPREREFESIQGPKYRLLTAHYMLLPALLLFVAALDTLSRAAIILSISLFFTGFLFVFFGYFDKASRANKLKMCILAAIALVVASFVAVTFAPKDLKTEAADISGDAVLQRVGGKGQYHQRVATVIFKEYPAFGVGGWGYKHLCTSYMTPEELKHIQKIGGVNVHDDYIQFCCEHGFVGAGLMLAILVLLALPLVRSWRRMYNWALFAPPGRAPAKPLAIYCVPPPVICVCLGCVATFIHSFGDCAMRCPSVLCNLVLGLVCTDGYFPRER